MKVERYVIENLIDQIEAEGLIQITFKRKPRTGFHAFFNAKTNERFYTYTSGYLRRVVEIRPYWNRQKLISRYAYINRVKMEKRQYHCADGKINNYKVGVAIMVPTEIERLQYLLDYMRRRNMREAKTLKNAA